jgi:putative ABC transport system substrate-binding protein
MRRREFIAAIGGAVAWPLVARAQKPEMPVIGFLATASPEANAARLLAFRDGLRVAGYVDGQNVKLNIVGRTKVAAACQSLRRSC